MGGTRAAVAEHEGGVGRGLDPPSPAVWAERNRWFWRCHDANAGPAALDLEPQAELLLAEIETVFSAGAWAAVVILAYTLVEDSLRRSAADPDRLPPEIDWLRERRNALVHADHADSSALALHALSLQDEKDLEATAQGAVRVLFKTLFAAAWR